MYSARCVIILLVHADSELDLMYFQLLIYSFLSERVRAQLGSLAYFHTDGNTRCILYGPGVIKSVDYNHQSTVYAVLSLLVSP